MLIRHPHTEDDPPVKKQDSSEQTLYLIQDAVLHALANLEFTGAVGDDFHAYWPFAEAPGLYTLPISKRKHTWTTMLANTRYVACFAIISSRCLEFYYRDERGSLARICAGRDEQQMSPEFLLPPEKSAENSVETEDLKGQIVSNSSHWLRKVSSEICDATVVCRCRRCAKAAEQKQARAWSWWHKNQPSVLRTRIHLDPETPAHFTRRRNVLGDVLLEEGARISLGQLGTLDVIRDQGMNIAKLHPSSRAREILEKPRIHRELLDPESHSGNIIEVFVLGEGIYK